MPKVKFLIIGAGSRGVSYSRCILENSPRAEVAAVAEPDPTRRDTIVKQHNITEENIFDDWRQLTGKGGIADAVIIATQDNQHYEPAMYFIKQGYHVVLEKPMSPDQRQCREIVEAANASGKLFSVCHVLRYTQYTKKLKKLLDSGVIGDIISIQHLEPVGYFHQAHSYIRGHWRNEEASSSMLLAKSCHDFDWLRYLIDSPCSSISSFGNLKYFKKDNQPKGAAEMCFDCAVEPQCPYSAKKIYIDRAEKGYFDWPVRTITKDLTVKGVTEAVEKGPYGRCVFDCDNNVVDHQVVNMLFENGSTVSFTMTGFTRDAGPRKTRIFGTKGEIYGNESHIEIYDFLTGSREVYEGNSADGTIIGGHGGGDMGLISSFITAIETNNPDEIITGPRETLESHSMVFDAELARKENVVVNRL
jgi:predicted dehydrogenase